MFLFFFFLSHHRLCFRIVFITVSSIINNIVIIRYINQKGNKMKRKMNLAEVSRDTGSRVSEGLSVFPMFFLLFHTGEKRIFTLMKLLIRESCKSGILFRQQGKAGRCQSPDPASSFFLPLLNCSIVRLFQCFSTSSFPVFCWRFLLRRVKMRIFTLIELLIVIAIICIL